MERSVKGDVVILPFSFSDLSGSKRCPALVLSDLSGDDIMLCQITSQPHDKFAIALDNSSFLNGSLPILSYIRPTRIFTADKSIILRKAGTINKDRHELVVQKIVDILQ